MADFLIILMARLTSEAEAGSNTQFGDKMHVLENIAVWIVRHVGRTKAKTFEGAETNRWKHSGNRSPLAERHYQGTLLRVCRKPMSQDHCWF